MGLGRRTGQVGTAYGRSWFFFTLCPRVWGPGVYVDRGQSDVVVTEAWIVLLVP
jgi:hypothetical protein